MMRTFTERWSFPVERPRVPVAVVSACAVCVLILWMLGMAMWWDHARTSQALEAVCKKQAAPVVDACELAPTLHAPSALPAWLLSAALALVGSGLWAMWRGLASQGGGQRAGAGPSNPPGTPGDVLKARTLLLMQESGRLFCRTELNESTLIRAMQWLQEALGAGTVALRLSTDVQRLLGWRATLVTRHLPECAGTWADGVLRSEGLARVLPGHDGGPPTIVVAVQGERGAVGVLAVEFAAGFDVSSAHLQAADSFANLCAMAIAGVWRSHEDRRIALMEERGAIAAELHDSLAQALAFMKIQVAQLQRAMQSEETSPQVKGAADDLRKGLSNAYQTVRQLIAAFRVRMGPGGLREAVQETIDELSERSGMDIAFEEALDLCPLEVNEEFHVMQVIREALSNTVRHSGAARAWVTIRPDPSHHITVTVEDDGQGFGSPSTDGQHHGLSIMKERARSLGGEVEFGERPGGGSRIRLVFSPERLPSLTHAGNDR